MSLALVLSQEREQQWQGNLCVDTKTAYTTSASSTGEIEQRKQARRSTEIASVCHQCAKKHTAGASLSIL
jgi:hypothetical protein